MTGARVCDGIVLIVSTDVGRSSRLWMVPFLRRGISDCIQVERDGVGMGGRGLSTNGHIHIYSLSVLDHECNQLFQIPALTSCFDVLWPGIVSWTQPSLKLLFEVFYYSSANETTTPCNSETQESFPLLFLYSSSHKTDRVFEIAQDSIPPPQRCLLLSRFME